jgi:hypothetical protein
MAVNIFDFSFFLQDILTTRKKIPGSCFRAHHRYFQFFFANLADKIHAYSIFLSLLFQNRFNDDTTGKSAGNT